MVKDEGELSQFEFCGGYMSKKTTNLFNLLANEAVQIN